MSYISSLQPEIEWRNKVISIKLIVLFIIRKISNFPFFFWSYSLKRVPDHKFWSRQKFLWRKSFLVEIYAFLQPEHKSWGMEIDGLKKRFSPLDQRSSGIPFLFFKDDQSISPANFMGEIIHFVIQKISDSAVVFRLMLFFSSYQLFLNPKINEELQIPS